MQCTLSIYICIYFFNSISYIVKNLNHVLKDLRDPLNKITIFTIINLYKMWQIVCLYIIYSTTTTMMCVCAYYVLDPRRVFTFG